MGRKVIGLVLNNLAAESPAPLKMENKALGKLSCLLADSAWGREPDPSRVLPPRGGDHTQTSDLSFFLSLLSTA